MADKNWAFVTAAYTIAWIVLLGYLMRVNLGVRRARAAYAKATNISEHTR